MGSPIQLVLLTGPGCLLCDEMKMALSTFESPVDFQLTELSIENDLSLKKAYWDRIPYLFVSGRPFAKGHLDTQSLGLRLLAVKAGLKRGTLPQAVESALSLS